jgi:DNA-binding NarL/FixJ family response regulator
MSKLLQRITTLSLIEENKMKDIMNMMVVEDNSRARRALTTYMSLQAGIKVTEEVSNGLEAINSIKEHAPDIVVMDVKMPVMDGLEATRIIKKNWPQIKIVILTMYPNYQTEILSTGADAFLVKGCSVNEMISTIHTLFQSDKRGEDRP